jgi:hypothetical protein
MVFDYYTYLVDKFVILLDDASSKNFSRIVAFHILTLKQQKDMFNQKEVFFEVISNSVFYYSNWWIGWIYSNKQ